MTHVHDPPPDERLRLAGCVREPIHVPGAVQAHGVLFAVHPETLAIRQVSDNTATLLDREPADLLGSPLDLLLDGEAAARLRGLAAGEAVDLSRAVWVPASGQRFDALCHRVDDQLIVELEPALPVDSEELLATLSATIRQLSGITTPSELVGRAAQAIRRITGFDRVMVYRFHPDTHGEVIADDHVDGMDDYLGLHYPASDIPQQARSLFLRKSCRSIVDTGRAAALLIAPEGQVRPPLDLTLSELRAVSPHHLKFMSNMGQGATLSLSMTSHGELVGMITCAHRTSRQVPYQLRRALVMVANQLTLQLAAIVDTARLERQLEIHRVRMSLVQQMNHRDPPVDGLVEGEVTLMSLLQADGVTISFAGESRAMGDCPPAAAATALAAILRPTHPDQCFSTAALADDNAVASRLVPQFAGIVYLPLGVGEDCIIWYRREVLHTVNWLGDQTAANRPTPLSPRNSFRKWKQTVAGRAADWDEKEVAEAVELRTDVNDVLLHRIQAQLAHQSLHDDLTGLANRRQATAWLSTTFSDRMQDVPIAVLFVDIDKFKHINDSFGHAIGDQMIIAAGARLKALTRQGDILARLGGDEFLVALPDVTLEGAQAIAHRIVDGFSEPVLVGQQAIQMSLSVGLALARVDVHAEPLHLLRQADLAMYQAKRQGGNQVIVFEPTLGPQAVSRLEREQGVAYCLQRNELVLDYQPIFGVADGQVRGAEALLRWDRPGHGRTYPGDFVPLLEETGLILPVGGWVLGEALRQLGEWRRTGAAADDFCLAVNVSARQFSEQSLVEVISQLLADGHVPSAALTLEITETAAMADRLEITDAVEKIAALGVGLSVDDFGTGYSSMSMLRSLPISQLKVDKMFVADLQQSNRHDGLAAAVINLAHHLGLTCVAEGVETAEQLALLRELDCDFAQGFYLGKPVSAYEFARLHHPV
jgi:diguanylate cyclase (GGDEF)-like protein